MAAAAAARPDAVAVRAGGTATTYAGLADRADALAARMRAAGAGPETVVAVALPRTADLVAALLAADRCGAAYLPIDPDFPAERVAHMLADSGAVLLTTTVALAPGLPEGPPRLLVDAPDAPDAAPAAPPAPRPRPDQAAYILYTSGSTGRPKGVVVSHGALLNFLGDMAERFPLAPGDVWAAVTTVGFDISALEVYLPLMAGATVLLAGRDDARDPAALARLLAAEGATAMQATPTLWRALAEERPDALDGLRALVGGEALPPDLAARLAERCAATTNLYGPTETTIWSTAAPVTADAPVTIGAPIANTRVHVLDAALRPVPDGVAGDLYIAGEGLARGYNGRAALTAERFTADPYGPPGTRMYRTGDLARWAPDGTLDFLGRTDHQVKVRGFRIEPGEIEAVLTARPDVAQAVVTAREDTPGRVLLAGYVVPARGADPDPAELRAHLAERLPDYMVPAALLPLPELPLTANRKIDRAALPAPGFAAAAGAGAPRDAVEERLCAILADVLGLPRVGVDDDFFAFGGHSLLATRVANRVRAELGVEARLRDLFDAPTAAGLASLLAGRPPARPPLTRRPEADRTPLSYAQERLWFLERLHGPAATYTVPVAFRLRGAVDPGALADALRDVAARHAVLRTVYAEDADGPHQRALPADAVGDLLEVRDTAPADLDAHVARVLHTPFDVRADVPMRAALLRLAPDDAVLVLAFHHIATDEWSEAPFTRDLDTAYAARRAGRAPDWPPLDVEYADFAVWQRAWLGGADDPAGPLGRGLAFWREALAGLPAETPLPADRPRAAVADGHGATVPLHLDGATTDALRRAADAHGATVFMVLRTAVAVLLHRMGGGDDIAVGTPVTNRDDARLHDAVGMFLNMLALRTDLSGDPTGRELLARVRAADVAAFAHADVPFDRVVQETQPDRSLGRHPLFQVMLTYQRDPDRAGLLGTDSAIHPVDVATAKTDLEFTFTERPGTDGLAGALRYATARFDRSTAEGLAARLHQVLVSLLVAPDLPIGDIEVLTDAERRALVGARTPTPVPGPALPDRIAATAAARPDAVAVRAGGTATTYAELDARADRIAHALRARGAGPETVVAVALPRTADLVAALLAAGRVGAAYLPIDPDFPAERIAAMCADSAAALAVTARGAGDRLPAGLPLLRLDDPATAAAVDAHAAAGPVRTPVDPATAAYHLYTSGSTGRPKGVVVSHGALLNFLTDMADRFPLAPGDVWAAVTTVGFDIAALELYLPLMAGATVLLADRDDVRDPAALARLLAAEGATAMQATPSLWAALAEERPDALDGLRALVGGEALPPALAARMAARCAETTNLYGPTETTIWSTAALVTTGAPVTIGAPIANTRVHVLDAALRPVPPGVPGDLYIAGEGLARGYSGRAALTAERFTADPYGPAGSRMYRTGDLARRTADGALVFLGRTDHQVKVRGFRIEPGEVEAALAAADGVAGAVAAAHPDPAGTPRLVGYVVPRDGAAPLDTAALRAHLAERLPDYMVPSAFVELPEFPLTANRKVDRAALPAPEFAAPAARAPRDAAEAAVCAVFAEVLGVPEAGVDDDFFALGGHSLAAARAANRIRALLGVDTGVRDLFEAPTPAALAARIGAAGRAARPALTPGGPLPDRVPASAEQRRLWLVQRMDPGSTAYNVPWTLRLTGPLDRDALAAAVRDVTARHDALRTVLAETGGEPEQRTVAPADLPARLLAVDADPRPAAERVRRAARAPFDLAADLPVRYTLVPDGPDAHVLVIVLHHAAADEWSQQPLLDDLRAAYAARRAGRAPDWPAPAPRYADYALWQRDLLGSADDPDSRAARQRAFWAEALRGLPEEILLPADRPRPAVLGTAGGVVHFAVPEELRRAAADLAEATGTTRFLVLRTAVAVLLQRMGGGDDIPLGTPVTTRTDEALHDAVGMYLNTLVLRTDLSGDPAFRELLGRVRAADLAAFAHADLPFDAVVDAVNPARSRGRHPLFQTLVSHQTRPDLGGGLDGLDTRLVDEVPEGARFDLEVAFVERPGAPGLDGAIRFAADRFDPATADALGRRLVRLLTAALADPDRPVSALDPLLPGEHEALLRGWNATARPLPDTTLADLTAGPRADPGAPALLLDGAEVSYAAFDARADRLARALIARGAGPEAVVAVALPRSADLVVALHAVVRAGAAYLPVDPDLPAERAAVLLGDADPVCVLTDRATAAALPADAPERVVLDDPDVRAHLAGLPAGPVRPEERTRPLHPDHPAYTIFTSGSTGRPKGVVVTHRAIANRLRWTQDAYPLTAADRVVQKTPASFDVSVWEFFWPFTAGAALVVAAPGGHRDPGYLAGLLRRHRATVCHFVPSMLRVFLDHPDAARCTGLRRVLASGEELGADTAARFRDLLPGVELHNLYGPTEAAVDVTARDAAAPAPGPGVPIGRPVWNTGVRVLDARLRPVPPGVPGELYLTGVQLARCYTGRPDLTAERFTADPHGPVGTRMYRTGDLARWTRDGELEYLGRTDHQVKIRGVRIEPGEVEAALAAHPGVRAAAVLARADGGPADPRLVGYAVARDGAAPLDTAALRAHLAERLPAHLVPDALVELPTLPLSPNGKLDRAALPAPDRPAPGGGRAPDGPRERLVADVFADLLGAPDIGADDDFFALGGNSLAAARAANALRARLGADVGVPDLFAAPTPAALAARLAGAAGDRPPLRPGAARDHRGPVPLSAAQRGMWAAARLPGAAAAYNVPWLLRLRGAVDARALAAAVRDLAARHDVLRTVHPDPGGTPEQRVLPVDDAPALETVDAAGGDADALVDARVRRPFDLAAEPPFRATLLRTGPDTHLLLLLFHHIAVDEWSQAPLLTDLDTAYAARRAGRAPAWPAPAPRYADYALWQRDLLGSADDPDSRAARQRDYWAEALRGLPEEIPLPADRPRPPERGDAGGTARVRVPADLARAVADLARARGATPFMVVQAAVAALLHRMGGGDDIPLGTPATTRTDAALHDAVGMYLTTLVLRTDLSGTPAFGDVVDRARTTALSAFAHADLPFDRVVEAVNPPRAAGRNPLFQTMVTHQTRPDRAGTVLGADAEVDDGALRTARFDLEFEYVETPGAAAADLTVRYAADRFDPATAAELADRLLRLLAAGTAHPERPVADLDLRSAAERGRLAAAATGARRAVAPRTLPDLLDAAPADAGAPALLAAGTVLDRAAFDARVNRWARELIARGAGPETVVAVALTRSADLVVALHAVVRAGAAYLPVDPEHPAERTAGVLADARPAAVLVDAATDAAVPDVPGGAARLRVDTGAAAASAERRDPGPVTDADRTAPLRPDHPAYAIFTSGSTGRPKGVLVSHRAIVNRIAWTQDAYPLTAADRVVQKTPASFDVSVWEFFWPFAAGAALIVADPGGHRDPAHLAGLVTGHGATVLHFVPSMLRAFLEHPDAARCTGLRRVLASGEALGADTAARFRDVLPGVELHNLYGPTEAAVDVTARDALRPAPGATVPLGRPVWNTGVRVLDARLRPVPSGVPGELYLTGVQLARCYVHRPDLTAERFTADPYGPPGTRMYRTGDLVRWTRDGELEYLGRTDFQVKIRGLRIELGEVEAVLAAHPGVAAAAAAARPAPSGGHRLVGYAVAAPGAAPLDTGTVLRAAADRLPDHMVPDALVELPALPLSPNGKLDRAALPDPAPTAPAGAGRAPAGPTETLLADLFRDLLRVPEVAADDRFFALGGDSILAIRLVSRARAGGLLLTPADVFTEQTPERLALAARPADDAPTPGAAADDGLDDPADIPPTPVMLWLRERGGPIRRFSQATVVHTPPGADADRVAAALQAVLDRHDLLRARLHTGGGTWRLSAAPPGAVAAADVLRRRDAAGLDADGLRGAVAAEARAAQDALDPEAGALVRGAWFDRGPDRAGRLLLVVHHLAVDGVSWGVLRADLAAAWAALAAGRAPATAPPPTSFARWARLLHRHAADPGRAAERAAEHAAWRAVTAGAPDPAVPVPDPAADTAGTLRRLTLELPAEHTAPLLTRVPDLYHAGVDDALLAALALALAEWRTRRGGRPDAPVRVDLEGHGRDTALLPGTDLSETVGWFTAVHPVRLDVAGVDPAAARAGAAAAGEAVKRVKEQVRARPGSPLGHGLLRHLTPEGDPGPDAPVLFNYLGRTAVAPETEAWGVAAETGDVPPGVDPGLPVRHTLEVNALTHDGPGGPVLTATWAWPARLLDAAEVRALAQGWFDQLRGLADHAADPAAGGHTPSDLTLSGLDQDEIDAFEAEWRLT
ncbi:non-ribosomal peptide synthetase [Nocardiopsis trehalosi]|uniref:non-ribosomal peptide synthetase n=1 Tax=Nocardiopsis trehalosi TaxID=109329 RepID=UPI002480E68E|nr:non-ribosomal peptide synthetase [Nocardiopsis trehalosi]